MDNVLAGFPEKHEAFFVGIPPTYPLLRGLKIWRRFCYRGCHAVLPPGDVLLGIPYWDVGEIG